MFKVYDLSIFYIGHKEAMRRGEAKIEINSTYITLYNDNTKMYEIIPYANIASISYSQSKK